MEYKKIQVNGEEVDVVVSISKEEIEPEETKESLQSNLEIANKLKAQKQQLEDTLIINKGEFYGEK